MRAALVDTSRWQRAVNVAAIKAAGFVGIVARCTIGLIYADPYYKDTQQKCKDEGLIFGGYHVLWPDNKGGALEMEWFDENAGEVDLSVLDVELTHGLTKAQVQSQALDWHREFPRWRDERHITYTGSWWWNLIAGWEGEADDGLWEAEYTVSSPRGGIDNSQAPTGDPVLAAGYDEWKFWQWTSGGKGIGVESESLDYNIFNGDLDNLRVWLNLDDPAPTLEQRVETLEQEAREHGWTI